MSEFWLLSLAGFFWRCFASTVQMQCSNLTQPCPRYQRGTVYHPHCICGVNDLGRIFQLHPPSQQHVSPDQVPVFFPLASSGIPVVFPQNNIIFISNIAKLPGKKVEALKLWFLGTSPDIIRCMTVEESDREMSKLCTNELMDLTSLSRHLWPKVEATDIKCLYTKMARIAPVINTKVALGRSKTKYGRC